MHQWMEMSLTMDSGALISLWEWSVRKENDWNHHNTSSLSISEWFHKIEWLPVSKDVDEEEPEGINYPCPFVIKDCVIREINNLSVPKPGLKLGWKRSGTEIIQKSLKLFHHHLLNHLAQIKKMLNKPLVDQNLSTQERFIQLSPNNSLFERLHEVPFTKWSESQCGIGVKNG